MPGADRGLAPGFLVAAPALEDPNFAGSLVLMAEHQAEGSLGFVVNRPAAVAVGDVLREVDPELHRVARAAGLADAPVLVGGPVSPERLWILYRPGEIAVEEGGIAVGDALALGGSRELLDRVVRAPGGAPFALLLGYAGWGPLQVENEVAAGAWVPLAVHADLVFGVPLEQRWEVAVRRLGLEPGGFLVGSGGAKA
jgi:putative transcriptional regulator